MHKQIPLQILLFGIARDIVGTGSITLQCTEPATAGTLLEQLRETYPALATLSSLVVAVNHQYADPAQALNPGDEIALIPPVSGG
jgi:molybdopterin synthase sulfur carrier subunit